MQNLMTLENEELHFYTLNIEDTDSILSADDNNIALNIINGDNFQTLYDYYLKVLDNPNKSYDKILIESWLQSLTINLDYVMNISRSLEDFSKLSKTKDYPYDVILEGINNQKIVNYFISQGLLNLNNKKYVKKSR